MKILTKEVEKDFEFHNLIIALEPKTNKKVPFVFTNGGTEGVAKEDLHTVKTNFDFSEKENEISFVMLPDTFEYDVDFLNSGTVNEKSCRTDFLIQYLNNLRVISYLPENILKGVKDKRLLALGYAEKEAKKEILKYIKNKYKKAYDLCKKYDDIFIEAEKGLTIHEQFTGRIFSHSVPHLFDGVTFTKVKKADGDMYLTLDNFTKVVCSGVEVIEEEIDILNSFWNITKDNEDKDVSIQDIVDDLSANGVERAYTTIKTVMDRLTVKSILVRYKVGKKFFYKAAMSKEEMAEDGVQKRKEEKKEVKTNITKNQT